MTVGQKDYEGYVDYCILRVHATTGTQRRRRLTTFSTKQKERKRVKQIEKEKKNLESALEESLNGLERKKKV